MKKRLLVVLVLITLVLTLAGATSALADSPRKATGGIQSSWPLAGFPPGVDPMARHWLTFNVVEKYPGGPVKGWYTWQAYNEYSGWIKMKTSIDCITFGELDGDPMVVFAGVITKITPSEPWEWWLAPSTFWLYPGQYVKIWARDGGSPGAGHDEMGFYGGDLGPSFSSHPGCSMDGDLFVFPVEAGNLVIHD